jgi:hypothetical protein
MLCALHCTVLPAVMAAAPFLASAGAVAGGTGGMVASSTISSALHALTLYFVLPVGVLSVALNARATGGVGPTLCSALSLLAIAVSNDVLPFLSLYPSDVALGAAAEAVACGCEGAVDGVGASAAAIVSHLPSATNMLAKLSGPMLMLGGQVWGRRLAAARNRTTATAAPTAPTENTATGVTARSPALPKPCCNANAAVKS